MLFCVMCVIVLRFILFYCMPPGINPFTVKNNNNNK